MNNVRISRQDRSGRNPRPRLEALKPDSRQASVRLADLAGEPFLMLTVDGAERSAMRYRQRTPHVPNVIFRTLSVEAVRSMVATGMGITILSDIVYRPWSLEGRRIDLKTLDDEVHTMDVGVINPKAIIVRQT